MMWFIAHGTVFTSEVVVFRRVRMPRKTRGVGAVGQQPQQRGSIDRRVGGTVGIVELCRGMCIDTTMRLSCGTLRRTLAMKRS